MSGRKSIGKKIRFEVFKRDHFTCQYCGRMAPDVILEVDHIKPVAEGGTNDFINLVTSCRDCNRGKGKTLLSTDTEVKKQQTALLELAEKNEQAEMMLEWKMELELGLSRQVEMLSDLISEKSGFSLSEHGETTIRKLFRQFSLGEILNGIDIAFERYFDGSQKSCDVAIKKIGGICYNIKKDKEHNGNI